MSFRLQKLWDEARAGQLQKLSPSQCINEYAQMIQSSRRNLLLVANDNNFPRPDDNNYKKGSRVYWTGRFDADSARHNALSADAYHWICSTSSFDAPNQTLKPCSEEIENIKHRGLESWRVGGKWPVEYCLSEIAEPHCKLHFELSIAILVTVLNLSM